MNNSFLFPQARIFNETPINPRRCLHILTKILYLLNQVNYFDFPQICVLEHNLQ